MEWLAGNRLRGTTAERPNFGLPSGSVGGWVELGRTTLGSAGDVIDVTSLPDKRYYMALGDFQSTVTTRPALRFNSDSGSNYADRRSYNGGADNTRTSQTSLDLPATNGVQYFYVDYVSNLSSKEKLIIHHNVDGNVRAESVGKWTNTSDPIDEFNYLNTDGAGDFASGSEVVVLGWDPADTHTSNFWEELASVNGDGTGGFDTGTFTSKKYLWVQAYLDPSTSARNNFRVGNTTIDIGSNYANRYNTDGLNETPIGSQTIIRPNASSYSTPSFFNMFIINNSANEKLVIGHTVIQNTAEASTAPNRIEFVSKWADISNQIDIIEAFPSSGNYSTTSQIKVWGAD